MFRKYQRLNIHPLSFCPNWLDRPIDVEYIVAIDGDGIDEGRRRKDGVGMGERGLQTDFVTDSRMEAEVWREE